MAVVLSNAQLTALVRAHPWPRDARGVPVPDDSVEPEQRGPYPSAILEQPDGTWKVRLDPRVWMVRRGDRITDGTRTWVITDDPKLNAVPGVPDVDFVACFATLDPPLVP